MAENNKSMADFHSPPASPFGFAPGARSGFNGGMKPGAPPSSSLAAHLSDWLCRRVEVLHAERQSFAPGFEIGKSVVACDRMILVLRGSLHYQAEEKRTAFHKGSELYIPAWVRRGWTASRRGPCELFWVEFAPSLAAPERTAPLHLAKANLALEQAAFTRLLELWEEGARAPLRPLLMEAELKAVAARFLAACHPVPPPATPPVPRTAAEREIAALIRGIKTHFAHPEAIAQILAATKLSANYARRLFREQTGMTLGGYLTQLRMREARYHLRETGLPVKEVARRVGYGDPLRFSKLYRQFWGHPPLAEREA